MQVKVVAEIKELSVKIQGPVQRLVQGDPDCGANVGTSNMTDVVCVFQDVDFAHGGRYHGEDDQPRSSVDGDIYQRTCTLDLAPQFTR